MRRNSRISAAIFVLCLTFSPLASAFFEELPGDGDNGDDGDIIIGGIHFRNPFKDFLIAYNVGPINDMSSTKDNSKDADDDTENLIDKKTQKQKDGGLHFGFFEDTCPRAEEIVKDVISKAFQNNASVAAGIVRLHLHDCFVNGCDASLLLDKTPSKEEVEKLSPVNLNLMGVEVLDQVKAQLEKECPGTVSCADMLAFGARDSLVLSGLPSYKVAGGRRDGLASRKADVEGNIAHPNMAIEDITAIFIKKGLSLEEMVVLMGAHSIGTAHCATFAYRAAKPEADKIMNDRLVKDVKSTCRNGMITMPFDSSTQYMMDVNYYKQMLNKNGLLESDQKIADDPKTRTFVMKFASDQKGWFEKFSSSIIKMGTIEVLTGKQGEIRKQCRFVN